MSTTQPALNVFVHGAAVSVNRAYRRGRNGQVYLTDAAANWKMTVFAMVASQCDKAALRALPQPLEVDLTFYGVRADADNLVKITIDGVKEAIGIDDRHFSPISSHVVSGSSHPKGVRIEIFGAKTELATAPALPPLALPSANGLDAWRVADLVDEELRERLRKPVEHVTLWPAVAYDGTFILVPGSLEEDTQEWGAFLTRTQARELRNLLNALPYLDEPRKTPEECGWATEKTPMTTRRVRQVEGA